MDDDVENPPLESRFLLRQPYLGSLANRAIFARVRAGREPAVRWLAASSALALAGCDPVVNIAGANFPAWMLCAIVGAILAGGVRLLFIAVRIETYVGPRVIIYPSLAFLIGCGVYLMFFNRI